ncbi:MAG: AMP-binding protein [Sphingomonadales bacterium]|nr:AMP-binding protein [Sphingomonadales bacterium]
MINGGSNCSGDFPSWRNFTITRLFDCIADAFPDRPVILTRDKYISYRDAQRQSRAWASGLVSQGLEPGDHVAIVVANHPEFPLVKLAIARAGCVAVPLNFHLRYEELHYVIAQSGSRMLVPRQHLCPRFEVVI